MVGKGGRVFRNKYKGHMDKTKMGGDQGRDMGMAGVGGSGGEKMQTTVLEQQFKKIKRNWSRPSFCRQKLLLEFY